MDACPQPPASSATSFTHGKPLVASGHEKTSCTQHWTVYTAGYEEIFGPFGLESPLLYPQKTPLCLYGVANRRAHGRATREQRETFRGLLPESQGQNLALTVSHVPC